MYGKMTDEKSFARMEMKVLNTIKKILYSSTFVFTVTVFTLTLFYIFSVDDATTDTSGIQMDKYFPLYLFSLVLGALNHLLTCKKIHFAIRLPLHFIGTLASVYVVFIAIFKLGQTSHGKFSVMLLLSIAYTVVLGIIYVVRIGFLRLCRAISEASANRAAKKALEAENAEKN